MKNRAALEWALAAIPELADCLDDESHALLLRELRHLIWKFSKNGGEDRTAVIEEPADEASRRAP